MVQKDTHSHMVFGIYLTPGCNYTIFFSEISKILESKLGNGELLAKIFILEFVILGILTLISALKSEEKNNQRSSQAILISPEETINILKMEYKELLDEILHRRRNTWLIHSILLASTFLISFRSGTSYPKPYLYLFSLILVVFSWFFQLTATDVNKSCWGRRHEIEEILKMKGPRERYQKLKESMLYKIRHHLWFALWFVLGIIYFLLLLISLSS